MSKLIISSEEKIAHMRKLGKLQILFEGGKIRITLVIGNYTRRQWFVYGISDAIEQFYNKVLFNFPLIEELNK